MNGEFGPVVAAIWNFYVIGIYTITCDLLTIVLGTIAIRRVQSIPWWAAALDLAVRLRPLGVRHHGNIRSLIASVFED